MDIRLATGSLTKLRGDAWVILLPAGHAWPRTSDPVSRRLHKMIRDWAATTKFEAALGEAATFPTWDHLPVPNVMLVGLGKREEISMQDWQRAAATAARKAKKYGWRHPVLSTADERMEAGVARAIAVGLHAGSYQLDPRKKFEPPSWTLLAARHERAVHEGALIGAAIQNTRVLANQPGNEASPMAIAAYARVLARRVGLACDVWGRAKLAREKCGALLAVAQGSANEPCLITLKHRGRASGRPLVIVGKTITFDTGGISIKPAKSMEWMKYDKSGGMAVLAVMEMAARLKVKRPVIGLLAAAENMPGSRATRPGDVVTARSGKTIEIINTDAEGRLVLADALSVAQDFKPAAVVDLATLTGAAVVAVGHVVSAIMGNQKRLVDQLFAAGESSGDRVWPLPMYAAYKDMLKTPFADLKNTGDGTAGAIAGGMFLKQFVADHVPWAHVDLTNAWEERDQSHAPAGANLFGAQLVYEWIKRFDD